MNSVTVYVIQAGLSFLMLFLLVLWFIGPYLAAQPIRKAMLVLLSPHIAHPRRACRAGSGRGRRGIPPELCPGHRHRRTNHALSADVLYGHYPQEFVTRLAAAVDLYRCRLCL